MIVLLLLGACFCVGFSLDEEEYGNTFRWKLHRGARSIEFTRQYHSVATVVWQRGGPSGREDSRQKVIDGYFVLSNLTQKDSGRYIMRDLHRLPLEIKTIGVVANSRSYVRSPGESLSITFDLERSSCNIFFLPKDNHIYERLEIVLQGSLETYMYNHDCNGFTLLKPCGILNEDLSVSCQGHFEVKDSNDNTALVVLLEMEEPEFDTSKIGIGIGVSLAVMSCCTCMRRCCCGKKSSKKDTSETPDAEPAVHYHEYEREPVGPRPEHLSPPSDQNYPAPPSYSPTGPLIHNPPMNVPPSYSEVSAPAEQPDTPALPSMSAAPVLSEPDPQFQLKGMDYPSILGSGSAISDVYCSDKLNFL